MKYFFTAFWAIVCIFVLIYGHSYWSDRTEVKVDAAPTTEEGTQIETYKDEAKYLKMAKNWPESTKIEFQKALREKKPFKILFVGSTALGTSEKGWAKNSAAKIINAYGSDKVEVSILTYDATTKDFTDGQKQKEIIAEKANLIVLEPLLLNDNGALIPIQDSLANLSILKKDVEKEDPKTTFILQPSYPIYGAKTYPIQVAQLKKYASENSIAYLDHWSAWPEVDLKNNVLSDQNGPTEKGNEIWEKFVEDYLIHK
jgi:hypothetical protein